LYSEPGRDEQSREGHCGSDLGKTIEINFCAQYREVLGRRVFWFGLTQDQEKRAGYDVYTRTADVC